MQMTLKLNLLALILTCFLLQFNAKANDTIPPVITLNGSVYFDVILNSVYVDPGATAMDDIDGNVTANIATNITALNPNVNLTGDYLITYIVSDIAGNSDTAIRHVRVFNQAEIFASSSYNGYDSCSSIGVVTFNDSILPDQTLNNRIIIKNFGAFGHTVAIVADITGYTLGSAITFPPNQVIYLNAILISATGTITNLSPLTFSVNYIWNDGTQGESCMDIYTTSNILNTSDKLQNTHFIIYPNPSSGLINVKSDDFMIQRISIFNVSGSNVYSKSIESRNAQFDLTNNSPGVYFMRLEFQNSVVTKRIIIE
jgi:hypothetical protein